MKLAEGKWPLSASLLPLSPPLSLSLQHPMLWSIYSPHGALQSARVKVKSTSQIFLPCYLFFFHPIFITIFLILRFSLLELQSFQKWNQSPKWIIFRFNWAGFTLGLCNSPKGEIKKKKKQVLLGVKLKNFWTISSTHRRLEVDESLWAHHRENCDWPLCSSTLCHRHRDQVQEQVYSAWNCYVGLLQHLDHEILVNQDSMLG